MHLKQFAFYTPGSSGSKRDLKPSTHQRRHGHGHLHQDRGVGDWVTATINGKVVSWINEDTGSPTATSGSGSQTVSPSPSPSNITPASGSKVAAPAINAGAGNWGRQAYYNAADGTADGLVFLNNHGGQGSGVFDYDKGMSLSYASSDSSAGSSSPQVLADTLLEDNAEAIIYTDKQCQDDSCGAYRPGSVAYHGFDGESKLFLMEFDMPMSGKTGFNMDMPAVWILNAAIPRTQQYGPCSCWPECGEWDIFEILDSGNTRAKSTLHAGVSGGVSDFFERPVNKTMKAAVIFDGPASSGHIIVLPDDTSFDATMGDDVVANLGNQDGLMDKLAATVFALGA